MSADEADKERSRLMEAALKVLRVNGFQGATVQDILDEAGLSTRAFYRQFRSKDDLLMAMFRTASERDVEEVARRVADAPGPLDALHAWIGEMMDIAYDRRRARRIVIFNVVARQSEGYDDEVAFLRAALIGPLLAALTQGAEDGTFAVADPVPNANAVFDLVWGFAGLGPGRPSPEAAAPGLADGADPRAQARRLDREAATAHVLRFCLPALGVTASATAGSG